MRRLVALVVLLVFGTVVVAACGGDDDETAPAESVAAEPAPAEAAAEPAPEPAPGPEPAPEPASEPSPAAAEAEADEITVSWDGTTCTLSGPETVSEGILDVRVVKTADYGAMDVFINRVLDGYTPDDVAEFLPAGDVGVEFREDGIPEFWDPDAYPNLLFVEANNVEERIGSVAIKPGLHWVTCAPFKDGYPPPGEQPDQLVSYTAEGTFVVEDAS